MELSRHNILTKIHERDEYLLVNLLSREADVLSAAEGARLLRGEHRDDAELVRKGYVVDPQEEARRYRAAYLDFVDARDNDELQLFYVPSYACNFGCSYCYQDEYAAPAAGAPDAAPDAVLAAFFAYVDEVFAERRKYVTVFGGEPLLPSAAARRAVEGLVEGTARRGLDLAVVTNGYHLAEYLPLLGRARIREVQITLDGTEKVHDARRYLKGGGSTFAPIVAGIDACLAAGLPVNLRSVVDRDNVAGFRELAHFAIDRGWTKSPLFKTQIGRNYELHHCQGEQARLYSRLSLYEDLHALVQADPALLAFHRPAFSVARFLFSEGELPDPLFDACPACKTEWAFDASGRIYPCTANVGKPGESVGSFYPTRRLDEAAVAAWQERDVAGVAACRDCALALACGGGCGAVAKNRTGTIDAPDCRPVRELLALGAGLYGAADAPA
ncbi:MAG: radical SAM protein [Polyangiaceae bacterium]|nr:radical SAM protein [Polyangiaceae bacterium]